MRAADRPATSSGAQTLARELKEELGAEIAEVRLIGALENRFKIGNEPRHEIVLVFDARFEDPSFYTREVIRGKESDGTDFTAVWHRPEETRADCPLYPEGLKELLASTPAPAVTKAPAKPARRTRQTRSPLPAAAGRLRCGADRAPAPPGSCPHAGTHRWPLAGRLALS